MSAKKQSGTKKRAKAVDFEESASFSEEEETAEVLKSAKKPKGVSKKKETGAKTKKAKAQEEATIDEEFAEERDDDSGEEETDEDYGEGDYDEAKPKVFQEEPFSKAPKKVYSGKFFENKVHIWGKQDAEEIYDLGCFGKVDEEKNELSFEEALLLMRRNKLRVSKDGTEVSSEEFYQIACNADKEFPWKFKVYEELRGRGLLVRTGFKFGTHFRVYGRGVKLKRGPKSVKEHTKWIVHAVPENYTCSFPELSRAVRLAHNIRAKMLWAVVDEEGDVTYYEVLRKTP